MPRSRWERVIEGKRMLVTCDLRPAFGVDAAECALFTHDLYSALFPVKARSNVLPTPQPRVGHNQP